MAQSGRCCVIAAAHVDEGWRSIDEAWSLAEHVGDPVVTARVLTALAYCQRVCGEYQGSSATSRRALQAVSGGSAWGLADLLSGLASSESYLGRFAACAELLPELEAAATRAGHHGAHWAHARVQHAIELARTGSIRTFLEHSQTLLSGPLFRYWNRSIVAAANLYLGAVDDALEHAATAVKEQPRDHFLKGLLEGNHFVATALAGRADAEALIPALLPWLPVAGRRNVEGAYLALETLVTGLAAMVIANDWLGCIHSRWRTFSRPRHDQLHRTQQPATGRRAGR